MVGRARCQNWLPNRTRSSCRSCGSISDTIRQSIAAAHWISMGIRACGTRGRETTIRCSTS